MKKFSMLIYGASGVGKTFLLGTAEPPATPMLIIDTDPGLATLYQKIRVHHQTLETFSEDVPETAIDGITLSRWQSLQRVYLWLESHPNVYKTVCWDSLTGLVEINRDDIVREMARTKPDHDRDIPELRDYLRSQIQIVRAMRSFISLPSSLIITGHSSAAESPVAGEEIIPDLSEGLRRSLRLKIDVIGFYYYAGHDKDKIPTRVLSFESDGSFLARSRIPKLSVSIENPTLSKIYSLVSQEQENPNVKPTNSH